MIWNYDKINYVIEQQTNETQTSVTLYLSIISATLNIENVSHFTPWPLYRG